MAKFIKHVGVAGRDKKVIIIFREVPGDSESALVIPTGNLTTLYHDDLIKAIESPAAQAMMEPSEYLFRQSFHDGTNMLNTIHQKGWMTKVPTKSIVVTPRPGVSINLADLNKELNQIARKTAIAAANSASTNGSTRSGDIARNTSAPAKDASGVIDDATLAKKFRTQAATFEAEAKRLLREASALAPKGQPVPVLSQVPATVGAKRGRPPKILQTV